MEEKTLVFDIETVGTPIQELTLSDKLKEYVQNKLDRKREVKGDTRSEEDKGRDHLGLDPDLAKVVCIGLFDGVESHARTITNISLEKDLISWFWERLEEINPKRIVSFNGKSFDIPILVRRSMQYGLEPTTRHLSLERYDSGYHHDIAEYLGGYPTNLKTLDFYCGLYGIPKDSGGHQGNEIRSLFQEGRFDEIAQKCRGDVEATYQLYQRLKPYIRR